MPAIELTESLAKAGARCFMYRFDFPIPAFRHALGACHAAEVPLVFGTHRTAWLKPIYLGSKGADRLSATIQDAWLSFARSGVPDDSVAGAWPSYEEAKRPTRILSAQKNSEPVREDPEASARKFWRE